MLQNFHLAVRLPKFNIGECLLIHTWQREILFIKFPALRVSELGVLNESGLSIVANQKLSAVV